MRTKLIPQHEFPLDGDTFNLAIETGNDPDRLVREAREAEELAQAARQYANKMQLTFAHCPGFVGGDAPTGEMYVGRIVVDPAKASEALPWLKRRFVVSENLSLCDTGLCFDVLPKRRRKSSPRRAGASFQKVEQFQFDL